MTLEQIKQVGLTYLTQRYLLIVLGVWGLFFAPYLFLETHSKRGGASPLLFLLGMPMLMAAPFLVGHAKMQFAHARARLTPHFLPAHLVVLGSILSLMLLAYPVMLAWLSKVQPIGLLALGFAIAAPSLWGTQLNRFWPMLISLVAFYSLFSAAGMAWWVTNASEHAAAHSAVIVAGIVAIVVWLRRLTSLDEEVDDYLNTYQIMLARRTGSEAIEQRRVVASAIGKNRPMASIGDWWHSRLRPYDGQSMSSLARLLRYGGAATPTEINGLFMLAIFASSAMFPRILLKAGAKAPSIASAWFMVPFAVLLPGQMVGEMLAQRRPRIANELLLPLSRQQLIDGLFASSVRNSIGAWFVINLGLTIMIFSFGIDPSLQIVAMYWILAASIAYTAMAISLRIAVWPSRLKRIIGNWLAWMLLVPPLIGWWAMREYVDDVYLWLFVLLLSILLLVASAIVMQLARRAWLELELG